MPHSFTARPGLNLKQACKDRDCTLQDLVNDALEVYLEKDVIDYSDDKPNTPKPSPVGRVVIKDTPISEFYFLHKSHPDIKLIKTVPFGNRSAYIDTDGHEWLMNSDMTLTPIVRV